MAVQTWIFQAQPRRFDIDGFFQTKPEEFLWLARQRAGEIRVGDQVFIWRAVGGGDENKSGIIGEAQVIAGAAVISEDPNSLPFWRDGSDAVTPEMRVRVRLARIAKPNQLLKREWLRTDPVLTTLPILRIAQGTNYPISTEHAARLNALWRRAGRDWNYAEDVAGLWAYSRTYGGVLSQLPGTPVSDIAIRIGRPVPSVYSKVLNFRACDPREPKAGLPAVGKSARAVWDKFYDNDARTIRSELLDAELAKLWPVVGANVPVEMEGAAEESFERQVSSLTDKTLGELLDRINALSPSTMPPLPSSITQTQRFVRSPLIAAFAKKRAAFACEVPGCTHPQFIGSDGSPYSEVHHITPLSVGGLDTVDNVASLCPAHHREVHFGKDAKRLTEQLEEVRLPKAAAA